MLHVRFRPWCCPPRFLPKPFFSPPLPIHPLNITSPTARTHSLAFVRFARRGSLGEMPTHPFTLKHWIRCSPPLFHRFSLDHAGFLRHRLAGAPGSHGDDGAREGEHRDADVRGAGHPEGSPGANRRPGAPGTTPKQRAKISGLLPHPPSPTSSRDVCGISGLLPHSPSPTSSQRCTRRASRLRTQHVGGLALFFSHPWLVVAEPLAVAYGQRFGGVDETSFRFCLISLPKNPNLHTHFFFTIMLTID